MRPDTWRPARVVSNERAAATMISLHLAPETPVPHRPGQHYEVRIPGDALCRSYSIASDPAHPEELELGVQVLPHGRVSPRLASLAAGAGLEIRGPLGQFFIWTPERPGNLILIAAGAGITPLLSIHAAFRARDAGGRCAFLVSAKAPDRLYRFRHVASFATPRFTESQPRLGQDDLARALATLPAQEPLTAYLCGPSRFVDAMIDGLSALGIPDARILAEGFS